MKYVAGASFLASLFLPDEYEPAADKLAAKIQTDGATAPGLMQLEISNILLMALRRGRISGAQVSQLLQAVDAMPIVLQSLLTGSQRTDVLRLAEKHDLTAYDSAYLELAIRFSLPLATLDKKLSKVAKAEGVKLAL